MLFVLCQFLAAKGSFVAFSAVAPLQKRLCRPCDGAMAVVSLAELRSTMGRSGGGGTQKSVVQQDGIPDFFQDFFGIEGGIKNAEALIVADNMA